MSFLTSIAARAAGIAPAVEPRLPSRYERESAAELTEVTQQATPPAPPQAGQRVAVVTPAMRPPEERTPVEQPTAIVERSATTTTITHHEPELIREIEPVTRVEKVVENIGEKVVEHHDTAPTVIFREQEAPLRALIEPRETTRLIEHQLRENTLRLVREKSDEAAPTIRVTIGRIDVRAIADTPAPAKPEPPRRKVFTIEDYIRLRKEGRR